MIEFFYDCSSPWTYLGFESICEIAADTGAEIAWKPILVGAVFNAVNPTVYEQRRNPIPAKQRYLVKDLMDWASYQGIAIRFPPTLFPVNSAQAMRACIVAGGHGLIVPFSRRVFQAYWGEDKNISSDDVLREIAAGVGLDADALISSASSAELRAALRATTDELIARGGFGSPTIFVGGSEMFFGNDRAPLIRRAVKAKMAANAQQRVL